MNHSQVNKLKDFLKESSFHLYAGGGKEITPERPGFVEMEWKKGDWYIRDSYVGHFQAPGITVVYYKNKPFWTVSYGGKVLEKYYEKTPEIFGFLKKALSRKELKKAEDLPVRGPSDYSEGEWKYEFIYEGDMSCFYGREKIYNSDELVFYQDIIGGLVIEK